MNNKPGPAPREDRSTVNDKHLGVRVSPALLARLDAAREDGESRGACVKRLLETALAG